MRTDLVSLYSESKEFVGTHKFQDCSKSRGSQSCNGYKAKEKREGGGGLRLSQIKVLYAEGYSKGGVEYHVWTWRGGLCDL